jgi:hypothetical protein
MIHMPTFGKDVSVGRIIPATIGCLLVQLQSGNAGTILSIGLKRTPMMMLKPGNDWSETL